SRPTTGPTTEPEGDISTAPALRASASKRAWSTRPRDAPARGFASKRTGAPVAVRFRRPPRGDRGRRPQSRDRASTVAYAGCPFSPARDQNPDGLPTLWGDPRRVALD